MNVFVTGGSGLVGGNITKALLASKKHNVVAPSRRHCNLLDYQSTLEYISKNKPDILIHCAGKVGGIQANIDEPVRFLVDNVDMGRNVILAAREVGVKRLINLGSSCMYPADAPSPLKESYLMSGLPEQTNEGYAIAKLLTQRLCTYIRRENSAFQYKTIIPCNLYGPGDHFDFRTAHLAPAVINKLHHAITNGLDNVTIWGDGSPRREFMYIGDLSDFLNNAINRFDELPDLINVGAGYDCSVLDYYRTAAKALGYKGSFSFDTDKPTGVHQKLLDTTLLKKFRWNPQTNLIDGIRETYEYYISVLKEKNGV